MTRVFNPVFKLPKQLLMVAFAEAPFALLEEPVKTFFSDAIESTQMTLGLIPEVFYPVYMVVFRLSKMSLVIDSMMVKLRYIKGIIASI